jgi:ribonuclease HII
MKLVCGIDEAGRGPLAGPVYAAAVVLGEEGRRIVGINDSKKLSEGKRTELAVEIKKRALAWSVVAIDVATVDRVNILQATLLGMFQAVEKLNVSFEHVLIDGTQTPLALRQWCAVHDVTLEAKPKADATVIEVGAASILAKTERDAYMQALEVDFPQYGFAKHKGYGTAAHLAAIQRHGPCVHHRKSFAPIARFSFSFAG